MAPMLAPLIDNSWLILTTAMSGFAASNPAQGA
jgi:hypothetical protein